MDFCFRGNSVRRITAIVGLMAFCLIAGCYERAADGNTSIYQFAWWIGPTVIAGAILSIPIGWTIRKAIPRWGFGLMAVGPILLVIVVPAMYSDYVLIDDEHFEARYGFWFSPSVQNVRFRDLCEIQYVGVPGNRGRTNYEMRCVTATGQVTVVPAGDLVRQTVPEILARASARGVIVVNQVP